MIPASLFSFAVANARAEFSEDREEQARLDAELVERLQRERNEEIYLRYVKGWFARTEPEQ